MRPYLTFHATRSLSHVGFPNGVYVRWGLVPVGLRLEWAWVLAFSFKFRNVEYATGFTIQKDSAYSKPLWEPEE